MMMLIDTMIDMMIDMTIDTITMRVTHHTHTFCLAMCLM